MESKAYHPLGEAIEGSTPQLVDSSHTLPSMVIKVSTPQLVDGSHTLPSMVIEA